MQKGGSWRGELQDALHGGQISGWVLQGWWWWRRRRVEGEKKVVGRIVISVLKRWEEVLSGGKGKVM